MTFQPFHSNSTFGWIKPGDGTVEIFKELGIYCPSCFSLSNDLGLFTRPARNEISRDSLFIKWVVNLRELVSAAENGCQWCSFVAVRVFDNPIATFHSHNASSDTIIGCCGSDKSGPSEQVKQAIEKIHGFLLEEPEAELTLVAQPSDQVPDLSYGRIRFTVVYNQEENNEKMRSLLCTMRELTIEVYAVEENPASKSIEPRPIRTRVQSEASIDQTKTWIDNCVHNHALCPGPETVTLPKRIIRILDAENLVLHEGGSQGKYAALSYVWGCEQTFSTTLETIERNKQAFRVVDLPKTLQDAVFLTRRLGLEYIWIDLICIIQDSEGDRDNELPKMSQYYRNSYITISAAIADTVDKGFLNIRDECENHPDAGLPRDLMHLPYICPVAVDKQAVGEILFREDSPYRLCDEPISKRGWTLQESILAPRVLSYGSRLLFQCHDGQHSDGGIEDWSFDQQSSGHRRIQREFSQSNDARRDGSSRIAMGSHAKSRLITYPTDKFPALSGLATEYAKISGDEYLAGLWRDNLLRDLMWSTYPTLLLHRPKEWRAPSWSWASVENAVNFDRLPPPQAVNLAEIVECSVTPCLPTALFGEITSATLRIRGYLATVSEADPSGMEMVIQNLRRELEGPDVAIGDGGVKYRRELLNMLHPAKDDTPEGEWIPPKSMSLLVMFARPVEGDTIEKHTQGRQMKAVRLEELETTLKDIFEKEREKKNREEMMKRMAEKKKDRMDEFMKQCILSKLPEGDMKEHFKRQLEKESGEFAGEDLTEEEKAIVLDAVETIDWERTNADFRPNKAEQVEGRDTKEELAANGRETSHGVAEIDLSKESERMGTVTSGSIPSRNYPQEVEDSSVRRQDSPQKERSVEKGNDEAEQDLTVNSKDQITASCDASGTEEIAEEMCETKSVAQKIEVPRELEFKDDKALVSCLVLVKQEDGRYERIATLQTMSVTGISNMRKNMEVVEII